MWMTGTEIPAALRRYLKLDARPIGQVDVENDTNRAFKIAVIF
jgi:hypothetical protein